ncbi:MAG: type II restriction endonuclease [Syntrophomonadaceae bacterium]|nr:type II restriction endonuclease [Syntrophomonadaceae bacterium]
MSAENLSRYFSGIATKYLSEVEVNSYKSNQHELHGASAFKELFGEIKQVFPTRFIYLTDDEDNCLTGNGSLTWYDTREQNPRRSSEYRIYYTNNTVMEKAAAGDLLILGLRPDKSIIVVIAEAGTTIEKQFIYLFKKPAEDTPGYTINMETSNIETGFVERIILEQIGIDIVEKVDESILDKIIEKFGAGFPSTKVFSEFSRSTLPVNTKYNPDHALVKWLEREEALFRMFEQYQLETIVKHGFNSVDDFVQLAISVINRRKSRAGLSLQNHLEQIFVDYNLSFSAQKVTENRAKPDFVFPDIDLYHRLSDDELVEELVTVLGAKYSCKDRWRQILSEAGRVKTKYLITIEPGITSNQTDEMHNNQLRLVVPEEIHKSYNPLQRQWLLTLDDFIKLTAEREVKGKDYNKRQ